MESVNKLHTSKLKNILNCAEELDRIVKSKNKETYRKRIEEAEDCVINAISEIAENCLRGNIPLNRCQFNKISKYHEILKKLKERSIVKTRKRVLKQQKGYQLISTLLPTALSFLFSVIGPYLKKKFKK